MNFIVTKLILFFKKEKKSFIYLDSLFNKLEMVNVIGVYNNLEKKMKIMQILLKKFCHDVISFMEKKKINHEIFTASWFNEIFQLFLAGNLFTYFQFQLLLFSKKNILNYNYMILHNI